MKNNDFAMKRGLLLRRRRKMRPGQTIINIIIYMLLGMWAFLQLFPLYWMFTFSLKNNTEIFGSNPVGLPTVWRWENYAEVFKSDHMLTYFFNSILISALSIAIVVIFGLMATYALTRMIWRGRKMTNNIFMLGLAIPMHAALLPVYLILRDLKLLSSHLALILPYAGFALATGILIFSGFIQGIPREMEESACLDGCNVYGIFFRIILPLMAPAISVVTIFTFLQCWNELLMASTYTTRWEYRTLTVGIFQMNNQFRTEWGPIGAGLTVGTIPILAVYILLAEKVQKSLVIGAVKG